MDLTLVTKPTLILDRPRILHNIKRMVRKTTDQQVELRPHFKTHQSREIGEWYRNYGVRKITVSSLGMAQYFAQNQWDDITVAFPVNMLELETIRSLAARIQLSLLVLDANTVDMLGRHLNVPVHLWIKTDVGTHRTGIDPKDHKAIEAILETIRKHEHLNFKGFLAHAGHSYQCRTDDCIQQVYDESLSSLLTLKSLYTSVFPGIKISLGDTPTASGVEEFGNVDEIRPGNFVFYDLMQKQIGACTFNDIGVALACPVVAKHPDRKQWIIYGGGIHFSKDVLSQKEGPDCYGRMVNPGKETWSTNGIENNPQLIALSQEHGVVQCNDETFHLSKVGDVSLWLPVHSCMTADAMGGYLTTEGQSIDHYRQHVHA